MHFYSDKSLLMVNRVNNYNMSEGDCLVCLLAIGLLIFYILELVVSRWNDAVIKMIYF